MSSSRISSALALLLAAGCPSEGNGDRDPTCTTELPYPSCGDGTAVLWTESTNVHQPDAAPAGGTVSAIEAHDGTGVRISFEASDGPESLLLPTSPELMVGDPVTLVPSDLGWRLESRGVPVAFVGVGGVGLRPSSVWPVDGDSSRVVETVADLEIGLTPACAGWAQIAACGVTVPDEGVVYYELDFGGTVLSGLPQAFELEDGRTVTIQSGGAYRSAFNSRSDCETATCLISRPTGFGVSMVFTPAVRTCSQLPAACMEEEVFRAANPGAFGQLSDGDWTVVQTAVADERTMVELERGDTSAWLSLPADPLFDDGETVEITRDAGGIRIETLDLDSAIYLGPHELPGDTIELGPLTFDTASSCGGWVPHHVSPDLCPVEAAEALSLTAGGTTIAPGQLGTLSDATATFTIENRGVFRTVENSEPDDQCAGCLDPPWGRSTVLVVRTSR